VLERSLSWFHHHHEEDDEAHQPVGRGRRNISLIIIGGVSHNFIDGLAIGAAFVVSPVIGMITTLAIAAHEIPRELGDFGLMLSKGMASKKVVTVHLMSAAATLIGAALVYWLGDALHIDQGLLLAFTAGFFIYIASSDIIPTIHAEPRRRVANIQTLVLIFGIVLVAITSTIAHDKIHDETSHDHVVEHSDS
jgi:zinc and cadmium transporter